MVQAAVGPQLLSQTESHSSCRGGICHPLPISGNAGSKSPHDKQSLMPTGIVSLMTTLLSLLS